MVTVVEQFRTTWLTTLLSCILFTAVTFFIFWNEGQSIMTWASYDEFLRSAVTVDANSGYRHDSSFYQGKVVHVIGPIHISEPLTQPEYNIQVLSAKLKSRVQMYQWIEEEHRRDSSDDTVVSNPDEITYSYHTDWRDYVINSNLFYLGMRTYHHNPTAMPSSPVSEVLIADHVHIGWAELGLEMKRKFRDYYEITGDSRPDNPDIRLHSGMYYHGDPLNHNVGDVRVHFTYAGREGDTYTAVGVLDGETLTAYESRAGPLVVLKKGTGHSLDKIPYEELSTWKFRAAGWLQAFAALMTLHPTWMTLLLRSSWVSSRLRSRSRLAINFGLATCISAFVISLAWIFHGVTIGFLLMASSLCPALYYSTLCRGERSSENED